jgi:hypothetical protein
MHCPECASCWPQDTCGCLLDCEHDNVDDAYSCCLDCGVELELEEV